MSIDSKHPEYTIVSQDWEIMRDLYKGERAVKDKGEVYLPSTSGMQADGMANTTQAGYKAYQAYKLRAVVPDSIKESVEILIGLLHQKPANITLPPAMEFMRNKATAEGESLQSLIRRVNEEQLVSGRLGLMGDISAAGEPYIAFYNAESAINWDDGAQIIDGFNNLNLVVLNETGFKRDSDFNWTTEKKYRVLQLGALAEDEAGPATYSAGVFTDTSFDPSAMKAPTYKGVTLQSIPFTFINSKDIVAQPDDPPLMGLARVVLTIYRGEADYRQSLFMQGQDTLVIIGSTFDPTTGTAGETPAAPLRTGAGSRIELEVTGDAKYIGVTSDGLAEQRMALESDYKRADTRTGRLMNAKSNRESGEALKTRLAAQTATLNQVALAGAAGVENILKTMATWMGLDPAGVIVKPNLEFADFNLSGQDILNIMQAKALGFPVSQQSLHGLAVDRGITELDLDTELKLLNTEKPLKSETSAVPEQSANPGMAGQQPKE